MSETGAITYTWRPAKNFRPGRVRKIESIILHSTEGREAGDLQTLVTGDGRQVSVHWYVTRTGKVYHLVQNHDTAFHAGATVSLKYSNPASIGIEQEHFDGKEDWPQVQLQAVAQIVAFLKQQYGDLEVVSHKRAAAPPGRKSDPEPYPWTEFSGLVAQASKTHWMAKAA